MDEFSREELKQIFKEGAKEWLEEKYASFGKWSLRSIGVASLFALFYFILTMNGWKH